MQIPWKVLSLLASGTIPGQIDSICRERCDVLAIQEGKVRYIDQWLNRNLVLGTYVAGAQRFVPREEAPVRDLRSPNGWRVIISVAIEHKEDDLLVRLRFFGPNHLLRATGEALAFVEQARIGNLFGGADAIFAITSSEEHAYNTLTNIWFLPERGLPKMLLEVNGVYKSFADSVKGQGAGVTIARQTYDGANSETKGTVQEFWKWNSDSKSLVLNKP